eukprot:761975-Hanusia_phi.AAC.1
MIRLGLSICPRRPGGLKTRSPRPGCQDRLGDPAAAHCPILPGATVSAELPGSTGFRHDRRTPGWRFGSWEQLSGSFQ